MPFGMVKPGPDCTVSGAKDLFNQIRKYAGAPEIAGEPTLQEIYDERGREFFDENWRRNDMIRFGHFEDEFFPHYKNFPDANFDKRHRIFPVEQEMLDLNPGRRSPHWKRRIRTHVSRTFHAFRNGKARARLHGET